MRGMCRTLALGAVLAAGTTAAMAQGINNTGYNRSYYGDPGYYGNDGRDIRNPGYGGYGYVPGPVVAPVTPPYGYYGNNYGYGSSYQPGWGPGYGTSEQRGWGSGGGAAYDRGYDRPYNPGYWGR